MNEKIQKIESYAHVLNADRSLLKLNPTLKQFNYQFRWVDATEFEDNFSEIVNVPKDDNRPRNNMIGREFKGISEQLRIGLVHSPNFGQMFMHMEYPGILLLQKINAKSFVNDNMEMVNEHIAFMQFYEEANDLLFQLRLFRIGEIRFSQLFQITSDTRQITFRKHEIAIGSWGDFKLTDQEATELASRLQARYKCNALAELAVKNFNISYDLPDGRVRFITLMTCLESLFNLGKDQIAHTIARHLGLIISQTKDEFQQNYTIIKKLYNKRNMIVHGGEYKGNLMEDYLDLSNKIRMAIAYCNRPDLTKEQLFEELNSKGF